MKGFGRVWWRKGQWAFLGLWACAQSGTELKYNQIYGGVPVEVEIMELKNTKTIRQKNQEYFYYLFSLKIADRPKSLGLAESAYFNSRQDLNKIARSLNLHFSPDKQHFAVSVAGRVKALYHLLPEGAPFGSDFFRQNTQDFADTSALDWRVLPTAERIAVVMLQNNRRYRELNAMAHQQIALALFQQPLASALDSQIINVYPQSELAKEVMRFGKAEKMFSLADGFFSKKIMEQITNPDVFDINKKLAFLTNDSSIIKSLDRVAAQNWLLEDSATLYFFKRIDQNVSLDPQIAQFLKAKSLDYFKNRQSDYLPFMAEAVYCVDKTGSREQFQWLLEQVSSLFEYNSDEINQALILNYPRLKNQEMILQFLTHNWQNLNKKLKRNAFQLLSEQLNPAALDSLKARDSEFETLLKSK
jgi:hypothetical protein